MFDNYFKYWDDLPADGGFSLFGIIHIMWLVGIGLVLIILSRIYLKMNNKKRQILNRYLGGLMVALEIYKDCILIFTGHMESQYLPLQLCGLAIFVEAVYGFWPSKALGEIMCGACLPGALSALIFPDWTRYPQINYMNLHSFILHGLLVIFPIMIMLSGDFVPKIKRIFIVVLFFFITVPIIYKINVVLEDNFMFLGWPSRGSPFMAVYEKYGYKGYIMVYGIVVAFFISFMYLINHTIVELGRKIRKEKDI